jgi:hypothetical protein
VSNDLLELESLPGIPEPFSAFLPVELALRTDTPANIFKAYGLSKLQAERLVKTQAFITAYKQAVEDMQKDGYSIRMKAKMQTEANLGVLYMMGQDREAAMADRIKAIDLQARMAKDVLTQDPVQAAATAGSGFTINMVFSEENAKKLTFIDGVATPAQLTQG